MKALFVLGTRPEAIKMAPVIREFQSRAEAFETSVCVTGQHRAMLDQVLSFFSIVPDRDINLMKPNQNLFDITAGALTGMDKVLDELRPDCVLVQGDTTTAFAGALAAFYKKIPVAHIEAGLRSGNLFSPYPEEANRKMIGHLAQFHFAPTQKSVDHLLREGITKHVYQVGNSVIDALHLGLRIIQGKNDNDYRGFFGSIKLDRRIVLITGHRRESFGQPFEDICRSIRDLSTEFTDVEFVYPVHFNPNVREVVNRWLKDIPNVHLLEPLDYPNLIWLMSHSYLVLTDSGGIQEEAPALGKPVLVMREVTEREEGITAGTARLVGTNPGKITGAVRELLLDDIQYQKMAHAVNPYGDGTTSRQIAEILIKNFK
ncbi:MAG TPA: UDP-N-acetylglucosamine 2-epimerase (non-hydrolyzing) [Cyclobacteriaceae bacterium]|nr:UDP-N-acetylglucosamine 2-epimerase (non-hydrolyzing) [Cyclobacteriaceae bacterium]